VIDVVRSAPAASEPHPSTDQDGWREIRRGWMAAGTRNSWLPRPARNRPRGGRRWHRRVDVMMITPEKGGQVGGLKTIFRYIHGCPGRKKKKPEKNAGLQLGDDKTLQKPAERLAEIKAEQPFARCVSRRLPRTRHYGEDYGEGLGRTTAKGETAAMHSGAGAVWRPWAETGKKHGRI